MTMSLDVVTRRPGRKGRDDRYYATWAAAYVDRVEHGSRTPVADLSKDPPIRIEGYSSSEDQVSPGTIRAILGEARNRHLLMIRSSSWPPPQPVHFRRCRHL
jgi:hypothetical protein